jgi:integrase
MADTRWLEQRSQCWYVVRDVPRPLRAILGKKRLIKSLETRDRTVAMARRHVALVEFERIFATARTQSTPNVAIMAGMIWRGTFEGIRRGDPAFISGPPGAVVRVERDSGDGAAHQITAQDAAAEDASAAFGVEIDRVRETEGDTAAETLANIGHGRLSPLLHYVDSWLAEGGSRGVVKPRTEKQYRTDLDGLAAWLQAEGIPGTIEAVTKAVAGRYVTEGFLGKGANRVTANRKISAASAYWRWLLKRTETAPSNPWEGQSLPKVATADDDTDRGKRPFTAQEAATLLGGDPGDELADLMRVAALSGMRIEEVYRLTVADCAGGWFNIRRSKSRAGRRRVPTHSALAAIVASRCADKKPTAFLFPEAGIVPEGRERSMAVSKRFGYYRKRLGIDEHPNGQRQSAVDFHSWRRWFITQARGGAHDQALVAAIVGHKVGNLTDDTYSGGPSDDRKRACVESVKLPA